MALKFFTKFLLVYPVFTFYISSRIDLCLMKFKISSRIVFRKIFLLIGIFGLFWALIFWKDLANFFIVLLPMRLSLNEIAAVFLSISLVFLQIIGLIVWFCDGEFAVKINPFLNKLTIHLRRNRKISPFKLVSELRRVLPVLFGSGVSHLHIESHLLGRYDDEELMRIGTRFLNDFEEIFKIKVGRKNDVYVRAGHRMLASIGIKPASEFDGYIHFSRK
jgi:hypothetical protein